MVFTSATMPAQRSSTPCSDEVVVRTHHLSKQYGTRFVVNNLNLEIMRGDIFGFLGPNGAGKTTTIRMLLGLVKPSSGSVEIFGYDLASHSTQILPHVGALVEAPALYPYMSGRDNLRSIASVVGGITEKRIDEVLELVGLRGCYKDRAHTYSLGMKQRLGLAMALLHDPELLVLDEPANGLDPAGIVEMRELMQRLSAQHKTVLVSSHLLAEVQHMCTRVAIVRQGYLVKETTVEALLSGRGEYRVVLEQARAALSLLQQQSWGKSAHLDSSGALITAGPGERGRDLNRFLVEAGFVPDSLTPVTHDLEQIFLRLTRSGGM
ncbi:ABC transporter ATP-binding protein [Ktedonosporobacter rubrisoli]|nr:ABC transporter ATP-binding protein [Ktedonosporobacter rubrisoli]